MFTGSCSTSPQNRFFLPTKQSPLSVADLLKNAGNCLVQLLPLSYSLTRLKVFFSGIKRNTRPQICYQCAPIMTSRNQEQRLALRLLPTWEYYDVTVQHSGMKTVDNINILKARHVSKVTSNGFGLPIALLPCGVWLTFQGISIVPSTLSLFPTTGATFLNVK